MKLMSFLITFLVGVVLGGAIMGWLAMRAGKTYLQGTRSLYIVEQTNLADQRWRAGQLHEALIHQFNLVQATSELGMGPFDPSYNTWPFALPFAAIALDAMGEGSKGSDRGGRARSVGEGFARAELGLILEQLGRYEEARKELVTAAKLMGVEDIERVKGLAKKSREARMAVQTMKGDPGKKGN